ncbi:MAG: hypothetical protein H0X51_02175 [Parachlamydiaceae bacterium]|nr:hypothetical protein [Parachlamydiaceae bacterium]
MKFLQIAILMLISCVGSLSAENYQERDALLLAHELETSFWLQVQNQNEPVYARAISTIFQGSGPTGTLSRDQYLQILNQAVVNEFALKHIIATKNKDIMVVTYEFTYKGLGILSGEKLSVWKHSRQGWKLVSHSFSALAP